jgi:hypothetical protein
MKDFLKEHIKTVISVFSTVSLIIGFLISTYINNAMIRTDLDNAKSALQKLESVISEQQKSYDKMMWFLMNRHQSKIIKADGTDE